MPSSAGRSKRPRVHNTDRAWRSNRPAQQISSRPPWYPHDAHWNLDTGSLLLPDESDERADRLFHDNVAAIPRNIIQHKRPHRVPVLAFFANMDSANVSKAMSTWLTLRPFYLRRLATSSLWKTRGFHRDVWRAILKLLVSDFDAPRVLHELGLYDYASGTDILPAPSTSDRGGQQLPADSNTHSETMEWEEGEIEEGASLGDDPFTWKLWNEAFASPSTDAFSTEGVDSDSSALDSDDDANASFPRIGRIVSGYFEAAHEDEQPVRAEDERAQVVPADWHASDARLSYYYEISPGIMQAVNDKHDIQRKKRQCDTWYDYERRRVLFFPNWLCQSSLDGCARGEYLLKALVYQGLDGQLHPVSRRIWPRERCVVGTSYVI